MSPAPLSRVPSAQPPPIQRSRIFQQFLEESLFGPTKIFVGLPVPAIASESCLVTATASDDWVSVWRCPLSAYTICVSLVLETCVSLVFETATHARDSTSHPIDTGHKSPNRRGAVWDHDTPYIQCVFTVARIYEFRVALKPPPFGRCGKATHSRATPSREKGRQEEGDASTSVYLRVGRAPATISRSPQIVDVATSMN